MLGLVLAVVLPALPAGSTVNNGVAIGLVSAIIAGGVSYLTARASSKAQVQVAQTTTRGQVEEAAFERAKEFYTDTIDRQQAEIVGLKKRVDVLERRVEHAENESAQAKREARRYRQQAQRLARALHDIRVGGTKPGPGAGADSALDETVIEILADEPDLD